MTDIMKDVSAILVLGGFSAGCYYLGFLIGKAKALAERLSLDTKHLIVRVPARCNFDVVTENDGNQYVFHRNEEKEGGNNA